MITGKYQIDIMHEGKIFVDGGITFSGLPRSEWEVFAQPDARNRIQLGINQLLIRGPDLNMLIDTGLGDKIRPHRHALIGYPQGRNMRERLALYDLTPEDITHVVFSHLHYDHCGGATELVGDEVRPVFKNASFYIQSDEWHAAVSPDEISRNSYVLHDFLPLHETGKLKFISGDLEIADGIFVEVSGGHTAAHQIIKIEDKHFRLIYPADICPTPLHLPPERREAFDLFPQATMAARKILLRRAMRPDTLMAFSHSSTGNFFRLIQQQNAYEAVIFDEA